MADFVSLRVPKRVMKRLHRLKAKLMLKREEKVSDAEVVREAVDFTLNHEQELFYGEKRSLMDYAGFIKGRPGSAAVHHDEVIYGR